MSAEQAVIRIKDAAEARRWVEKGGHADVKVGLADIDGILRGKYLSRDKFVSALEKGFGFCDVIVGWDSNDQLYDNVTYTGWHTAYPDAPVRLLPETGRMLPFENGIPFFLCELAEAAEAICPRGLLRRVLRQAEDLGFAVSAAFEYEFFVFDETPDSVRAKGYRDLKPLTPGYFGYSVLRSSVHAEFYRELLEDEPRARRAPGRHGPPDPARRGDPLQRRGRRRPARPAQERSPAVARRGPAGGLQSYRAARPRPRARRRQQLAGQGSVPDRRATLRRQLCRERHAAAAPRPRPVLAEDPGAASRGRPRGAGALQEKFPALLAAVARDHPEAERLEVWFQDEARVGQTGRLCRRWYQQGMRPRGLRDLRHEAVWLFGAVCPERDAGVALVLPGVGRAAMQAMLDELSAAVASGAHAGVLMDRAGWHIAKQLAVPANHALVPAGLLARAERDRAGLAGSARALPLAPPVAELRRHP